MNVPTKPNQDATESARGTRPKDLTTVTSNADAPVKDAASAVADELASARCRMEAGFSGAKSRVVKSREFMAERARGAAEATCSYVNDNPWKVAGVAAIAGLVVGISLSQRKVN